MSVFRILRESLLDTLGSRVDDGVPADGSVEEALDIEFSPNLSEEAELAEMLHGVELARQSDPALWEEVFGAFCGRLCAAYLGWVPDDQSVLGARRMAAQALSQAGRTPGATSNVRVPVSGCRAGHPRGLLTDLVDALRAMIPSRLAAVDPRDPDPELASLPATLAVLRAVRLTCRARHNRVVLGRMGLADALRSSVDELSRALTSALEQAAEPSGGSPDAASRERSTAWIESALSETLSLVLDLRRLSERDGAPGAVGASAGIYPVSASLSPTSARRLVALALVPTADGPLPTLALEALRELVAGVGGDPPTEVADEAGDVVVEMLRFLPDEVPADGSCAPLEAEAVLETLASCVRCEAPDVLARMLEVGLQDRLGQALAVWYGTLPASQLAAVSHVLVHGWLGPMPGTRARSSPRAGALPSDAYAFLRSGGRGGGQTTPSGPSAVLLRVVLDGLLQAYLHLAAVEGGGAGRAALRVATLDVLGRALEPHLIGREGQPRLSAAQERLLRVVRDLDVWRLLVERDFLLPTGSSGSVWPDDGCERRADVGDEPPPSGSSAPASTPRGSGNGVPVATPLASPSSASDLDDNDVPYETGLRLVTGRAGALLVQTACSAADASHEVHVLLEALDGAAEHVRYAVELCGALHTSLDLGCSAPTAAALSDPEAVVALCRLLASLSVPGDGGENDALIKPDPTPDTPDSWVDKREGRLDVDLSSDPAARATAGRLTLDLILLALRDSPAAQRAALLQWDVVAACFLSLPSPELRRPALRLISLLATVQPVSEDDLGAKTAFVTKFVEMLPVGLAAWHDGNGPGIVFDLLTTLRHIARARRPLHQRLLARSQCFTPLLNILGVDEAAGSSALAQDVCISVLHTLRELCQGCRESRQALGSNVGYGVLLNAVLRYLGDEGPGDHLLRAALELALEEDVPSPSEPPRASAVVAEALPLYFGLLRAADRARILHGLEVWGDIVSHSVSSLIACYRSGTTRVLIDWLASEPEDGELQRALLRLIRTLAAHSVSAQELRTLLDLLRADEGGFLRLAYDDILEALGDAFSRVDPPAFFHADPDDPRCAPHEAGGVHARLGTNAPRFPGAGMTLSVWLRAAPTEATAGAAPQAQRTLLSLGTAPDAPGGYRGLAIALAGDTVLVHSWSPAPAAQRLRVGALLAFGWHHLTVTHLPGGTVAPPALKLYVDGNLVVAARVRYPSSRDPLGRLSVGAPHERCPPLAGAEQLRPWVGQLGAAHLFADALTPERIAALCALGPAYQSAPSASESSSTLDQNPAAAAALIRGMGAPETVLVASPEALGAGDGRARHGTTFSLGTSTHVCAINPPGRMLHCLGGVATIMPLLTQVPLEKVGGSAPPLGARAAATLRLLRRVLAGDASHARAFLERCGGCAGIAEVLSEVGPGALCLELLREAEQLATGLANSSPALEADARRHLVWNLELWSAADPRTQHRVLEACQWALEAYPSSSTSVIRAPDVVDLVREKFARGDASTSALRRAYLDVAKAALVAAADFPDDTGAGAGGERGDPPDPHGAALMSLLALLVGNSGLSKQALEDVSATLCALLGPDSLLRTRLLASLDHLGGPQLFLAMVRSPHIVRRVHGLRLLGYAATKATDSLVGPVLRVHLSRDPITAPVRIALVELLCGGVPWAQIEAQAAEGHPPDVLVPSAVRPLLTGALRDARSGAATLDLLCMLSESQGNRSAFAALPGLPDQLLKLVQLEGIAEGAEAEQAATANGPSTFLVAVAWDQAHSAMLAQHLLRQLFAYALLHLDGQESHLRAFAECLRAEPPGAAFYLRTLDPGPNPPGEVQCSVCNAQAALHEMLADALEIVVSATGARSAQETEDGWTTVSHWENPSLARNVAVLCGLVEDALAGAAKPNGGEAGGIETTDATLLGLWSIGLGDPLAPAVAWRLYPAPLPFAAWRLVVTTLAQPAAVRAIAGLVGTPVGRSDATAGLAASRPSRLAVRLLVGAACHCDPDRFRAEMLTDVLTVLGSGLLGPEQLAVARECLTQLVTRARGGGNVARAKLADELARLLSASDESRDTPTIDAARPSHEYDRLRAASRRAAEAEDDPAAWPETAERIAAIAEEAAGRVARLDRERRHAARLLRSDGRQVAAAALRTVYRAVTQWPAFWAPEIQDLHWKLDTAEDLSRRRFRLRRKYNFTLYGAESETESAAVSAQGSEAGDGEGGSNGHAGEQEADGVGASAGAARELASEAESADAMPEIEVGGEGPADGKLVGAQTGGEGADQGGEAGSPTSHDDEGRDHAMSAPEREGAGPPPDTHGLSKLRWTLSAVKALTVADDLMAHPALPPSHPGSTSSVAPSSEGLSEANTVNPPAFGALYTTPANWIRAKGVWRGELFLTADHLHFAGYELQDGAARAEDPRLDPARQPSVSRRWPLADVRELHHCRYLLQPSALELFMEDRSSHVMFSFPSAQMRRDFLTALSPHCHGAELYDRDRKMEAALRLQQEWLSWKISNFDYLMALNTLAGRTYNDLNQYPIFPWVLADYVSEELDLNDPASFRDLSKPVGALDEDRLRFFKERYASLQGDEDVPPFFYGTHYSSAASVLFFLIRLEPFTKYNRQLQGGRFDHADRLFHSIAAAWDSCLHNTSDVKELVPEFYYQPEFLRNANGYWLGRRQDGTTLGDTVLPPWACGSPDEFVRIMREALESVHVSTSLHQWIDLIFGFRQRGYFAEESCNTFFHLTYEGSVNLDAIADPMQRMAAEDQIRHFGQVPIQLFRRRHPGRSRAPSPSTQPLLNGPDAVRLAAALPPPAPAAGAVAFLSLLPGGKVLAVHANGAILVHRRVGVSGDGASSFTFGSSEHGVTSALVADPAPARELTPPAASTEPASYGAFSRAYAAVQGGAVLVHCATDGSLVAHAVPEGTVLQTCRYHRSRVTCVDVTNDGLLLVSGSEDTTLLLWSCDPAFKVRRGSLGLGRPRTTALPLVPQPLRELHGHRSPVLCASASSELGVVASSSADGLILVHSLATGTCTRAFSLPNEVPAQLLAILPESGQVLLHSHIDLALHLATLGGRLLVSLDLFDRLADLRPTTDGRLLLTAGSSGRATLRWTHNLHSVMVYDVAKGPMTALHVEHDRSFVAGFQDGSVAVLQPDPRRRITHRFNLANARALSAPSSPRPPPEE